MTETTKTSQLLDSRLVSLCQAGVSEDVVGKRRRKRLCARARSTFGEARFNPTLAQQRPISPEGMTCC